MKPITPQLSIISRAEESEQSFLPANFKPSEDHLRKWYKAKDVICHCGKAPIRMHIKHRLDTDRYFLSTNPTSPKHAPGCIFEHYRPDSTEPNIQNDIDEQEEISGVVNLGLLSPSGKEGKGDNSRGEAGEKKIVRLIRALYEDSFTNYFHGRRVPLFSAIKNLQSSSLAEELTQADGTPIAKSIFYGKRGLVFARQFVERSHTRGALWLDSASKLEVNKGLVITNDTGASHYPLDVEPKLPTMPGPYLVALHIVFSAEKGKSIIKSAYALPVIDSQVFIPVRSSWHREAGAQLCRVLTKGESGKAFIGFPAQNLKNTHGNTPIIILGLKKDNQRKRYLLSETPLAGEELSRAEALFKASPISMHVAEHELLRHVT